MCESKVYRVQPDLEHKCFAEDPKVGVCMPEMRGEKDKIEKDSIPEKIVLILIKIFFSFSVAYFVSLWARKTAYDERGYEACGGEYILIIIAFAAAYYMVSLFFKYFRREKKWKKGK